jgi:hypothetical protein
VLLILHQRGVDSGREMSPTDVHRSMQDAFALFSKRVPRRSEGQSSLSTILQEALVAARARVSAALATATDRRDDFSKSYLFLRNLIVGKGLERERLRVEGIVEAMVPKVSSARRALANVLQQLKGVESVSLISRRLRKLLELPGADGASFRRDMAAVSMLRALQRTTRYCVEFAKTVSSSPLPRLHNALESVRQFEEGFVNPVLSVAAFDDRGRLVHCRPGLSAAFFESCNDLLSVVLDSLGVGTDVRVRNGLLAPLQFTSALCSSHEASEASAPIELASVVAPVDLRVGVLIQNLTSMQETLLRELPVDSMSTVGRVPLAIVLRGRSLQAEIEEVTRTVQACATLADVPDDQVRHVKVQLQTWLARLHAFRASLDARDDLTRQKERVKAKWAKLNSAVFGAEPVIGAEFAIKGVSSPDSDALRLQLDSLETMCQELSGPSTSDSGWLGLLQLHVKQGLHVRAWEGMLFSCINATTDLPGVDGRCVLLLCVACCFCLNCPRSF